MYSFEDYFDWNSESFFKDGLSMMFSKHLLVLKLIWVGVTTSMFRAPLHTKEGRKAWTLASVPPEKSKALKKKNWKKGTAKIAEFSEHPDLLSNIVLFLLFTAKLHQITTQLRYYPIVYPLSRKRNRFSPFRRHRQNPTGVGQHHHWAVTCCDGFATLRWATAPILRW